MEVNFKIEDRDLAALRAIKPLVIEVREKNKDIGFTAALNKAVKELGYVNYAAYRLDSMSNSIVQRHI